MSLLRKPPNSGKIRPLRQLPIADFVIFPDDHAVRFHRSFYQPESLHCTFIPFFFVSASRMSLRSRAFASQQAAHDYAANACRRPRKNFFDFVDYFRGNSDRTSANGLAEISHLVSLADCRAARGSQERPTPRSTRGRRSRPQRPIGCSINRRVDLHVDVP
jgi:hypothetical protein